MEGLIADTAVAVWLWWGAGYTETEYSAEYGPAVSEAGRLDLGVEAVFDERVAVEAGVGWWDATFGTTANRSIQPYLSRGSVALLFGEWGSITAGRQSFQYGEGLFISDLGRGSDGVRLHLEKGAHWAELFTLTGPGPVYPEYLIYHSGGAYLHGAAGGLAFEPYGLYLVSNTPDGGGYWTGARAELTHRSGSLFVELTAEVVVEDNSLIESQRAALVRARVGAYTIGLTEVGL